MNSLPQTLNSYLPALASQGLRGEALLPGAPAAARLPAAVLAADITGFTAITERMAAQGPAGVEELSARLNDFFGRLIDSVVTHGGDVVKFAGDGLLAVWPADSLDTLVAATAQAAHCALQVQQQLAETTSDTGPLSSMRIGIGAGEVVTIHLGGVYDRWEFIVAGAPLDQATIAQQAGEAGHVIVAEATWPLLAPQARGVALSGGHVRLEHVPEQPPARLTPLPPAPEEQSDMLRSYIPSAVLARLEAGQTDWLAELRRVTVVFINLPDLNHHTPLFRAQELIIALQRALYHYGGSLDKISVDHQGTTVMAVFGLPLLAHEDDAARAVLATLAIQKALNDLAARGSVGVTTGQAFCGTVGNSERREFTVIGDVVNLSARLMHAAPEIESTDLPALLCDAGTYATTQARFEFVKLAPIAVKGKAEQVPVFCPQRELHGLERAATKTGIIGRARERGLLADHIQKLLFEESSVAIVRGDAGIGKSNLIDDLRRQADSWPITVLTGAGDAIERGSAYHGWRRIFSQLFHIGAVPNAEAQRQHVLNWLAEEKDIAPLAALLNVVLPFTLPETDQTLAMSGQVRADNTRNLLITLIERLSNPSPLVIILEDAQWLDSASWTLALEASRRISPLLLIVVTRPRPERRSDALAQLLDQAQTSVLDVEPLRAVDLLTVARRWLGVQRIPRELAELLIRKAEGNPFFCQEMLNTLRDNGTLVIDGEDCLVARNKTLDDTALPLTLQGMVISRLDRLPPPQQLTIKVASVIGRQFTWRTLQAVYPLPADRHALPDYLETLENHGLTVSVPGEAEPTYRFRHSAIHEAAYNLLLFQQRQQLHLAVARWFEQFFGVSQSGRLGQGPVQNVPADQLSYSYVLPLLVHHYHHAGETTRERFFVKLAARQSAADFANQEAIAYLGRALELAGDQDVYEHFSLLLAREEVYHLLGDRDAQRRDLQRLNEMAQQLGGVRERARVDLRHAAFALATGDYASGIKRVRQAIQRAATINAPALEAEGSLLWGQILSDLGNAAGAEEKFMAALNSARAAHDATLEAEALHHLGRVYQQRRELALAKVYYEQALVLYQRTADRRGESQALIGLGAISDLSGDSGAAIDYFQLALLLNRAIGNRQGEADVLANLATAATHDYRFTLAQRHFTAAGEIYRAIGDRSGHSHVLRNLGINAHSTGDYAAAQRHYEQAIDLFGVLGKRQSQAELVAALGLLLHDWGRNEESLALAQRTVESAAALGLWQMQADGWTVRGHACLALQRNSESAAAYEQALVLCRKNHEPLRARTALVGLARARLENGDIAGARKLVQPLILQLNVQAPRDQRPITELVDPLRNHIHCYEILQTAADPRALSVLQSAKRLLQRHMAAIEDERGRRSMRENSQTYQAIQTALSQAGLNTSN